MFEDLQKELREIATTKDFIPTNLVCARYQVARYQVRSAHESPRTTNLYDRTNDELTLDEIEKIHI